VTIIGFIGSGYIGGTVARLSVEAGYQVVMSNSRGPATLADVVADIGPLARAASAEEAAATGDIVVVSIPFRAYRSVPAEPLAGKAVLDTCNYYPERDGHIAVLDDGIETSSELLQRQLAGAQVDAGNLADSWRQEPGTPVYGPPYGSFSDESGTPAGEAVIREALEKASR